MKVKLSDDLLGHRKDTLVELPEEQGKALIDQKLAAAPAPAAGSLDEALGAIQGSIDQQLQNATATITNRVLEEVSKTLRQVKPTVVVGPERRMADPTGGFANLGDFAQAVRRLATNKSSDPRLLAIARKADGMDESVLADGGALVPQEYANALYRDVLEESLLFGKARKYPINLGNTLFVPVRVMTELGVTAASGGSLGSWLNADGVAIAPQKPVYSRVQFTLNRWGTLLPVTDELLQDNNVALSNFIIDEGGIALAWDMNQAFINGSGLGQPQGILAASALVQAPADSGQLAGTISYSNLVNMKSLLWTVAPGDMSGVVWIANPDAEAQFEQLKDSAGRNLYYAAGTIGQTPVAKLFGIPVVYSYHCPALGDSGDVILADLKQYGVATKAGGQIETAMSMHLYFDAAEVAFRIIYRIDGKVMRQQPLKMPNSPNSRSGFVCLEPRGGGPAS